MSDRHRVVIIGGGFGGLYAARALAGAPVELTLIDRRNFHLFQPLLYQVATGGLSPADIASPLRWVLRRQANTHVLLAEAVDLDVEGRRVLLRDGDAGYDSLIVAAGVRHHYFGNDAWEQLAPGLKTVEDATEIRRRILGAFEDAELEPDPGRRRRSMTFAIVGAGPTGVELAGTLAEIARETLRNDFRAIRPGEARIVLLEHAERVLPSFPPDLSAKAAASLAELGVEVRVGTRVEKIESGAVGVRSGGREEVIPAGTVLWAAGVRASPLGAVLARRAGAELDANGRVVVGPDLTIAGHPEIFVIGDLACFRHGTEKPLPGLAPVAIQQARHVAETIQGRLAGETGRPPFRYHDRGNLAAIGRSRAVAQIGRLHLSGLLAWLIWAFVHLMELIGFENRVLVFVQWAWNYFTRNRSARLITGVPAGTDRERGT